MKLSPFPVFVIALAATAAWMAGYALLDTPAPPARPAAILAQAQPDRALPGEPRIAGASSDGGQRAGSEAPGSTNGEASSGIEQPGPASVEFQATGITNDHSAGSAAAGIPPARWIARAAADDKSRTAPASLDAPPAPSSALIPLAFRPLPPGVAASNPRLQSTLNGLQQDFIADVGGPNQNPNDPAYYQRWITAQQASDELYRLQIGDQAYLLDQIRINSNK
jgi:hypothetical protein